jgi:SAM-dependent methyltransferase
VEKAIADRLRQTASREERARIYRTMYDELFAAVPDHARLTRAIDPVRTAARIRGRFAMVRDFLRADARVLDIGAGDCTFSAAIAAHVRAVYALEISDGSVAVDSLPPNMAIVLYDGFYFPFADASLTLAFSDQLVEHLHVDDQRLHFGSVAAALAPGGVYVMRTPHRFTGPHDISKYFTDGEPQGFHMKEWTYRELCRELRAAGFHRFGVVLNLKGRTVKPPLGAVLALERVLGAFPRSLQKRLSRYAFATIGIAAHK